MIYKTLIIAMLLLTASKVTAQKTYNVEIYDNSAEVYPLMVKGFLCGSTAYYTTYELLFRKTNIDQSYCRVWASLSSILAGFALNKIKGRHRRDLGFELIGSTSAAFTATILIGHDRKRNKQREKWKHQKN